jgi:hypothetical protein
MLAKKLLPWQSTDQFLMPQTHVDDHSFFVMTEFARPVSQTYSERYSSRLPTSSPALAVVSAARYACGHCFER